MAYLVSQLSWHDYATLKEGRRVRILRTTASKVYVDDGSGQVEVVPVGELKTAHGSPQIEYGVRSAIANTSVDWAILALAIMAPVPVLGAIRWWILLRALGVKLGLSGAVRLTYLGNFLNFVSPGLTGGDVLKAYYATKATP
ncbi:unnamed protein product, partial [marine sediment metagenome]